MKKEGNEKTKLKLQKYTLSQKKYTETHENTEEVHTDYTRNTHKIHW